MQVTLIDGERRYPTTILSYLRSFFLSELTLPRLGSKSQVAAIEKIDAQLAEMRRRIEELEELRLGLEHYDDIKRTVQLSEKYL